MPKVYRKPRSRIYIQAILFPRSIWSEDEAEEWLHSHNKYITPEGPHVTANYLRYRQVDPQPGHKYRIHRIPIVGIDMILGISS